MIVLIADPSKLPPLASDVVLLALPDELKPERALEQDRAAHNC